MPPKDTTGFIDAQQARKCSKSLMALSKKLDEYFKVTERGLRALGNDWKDRKHEEFSKQFFQDLKKLKPLVEDMQAYSRFLEDKAKATEDFDSTKVK